MTARSWSAGFWVVAVCALLMSAVMPVDALANDIKKGWTAFEAHRYDEALGHFDAAFRKGRAEGQAGIGMVHLERRNYKEAKKSFELAQRMDGNLASPVFGLGEIIRREGHCDEAIPLFQKATQMDRKYPEAELSLGKCLIAAGRYDEAIKGLARGLKWGEKWRPKFLVALGNVEFSRDSLRDAGIYYTRARQEAPSDPAPAKALGDFYLARGTYVLAVPEYMTAVNLDTSDVRLRFAYGRSLFYTQRYTDALKEYKVVVSRDPEFAEAQLALGDLLHRAGAADTRRIFEAREPLEKYTELEPEDPKGWSLLGQTYAKLRLRQEALEALDKAESLGDETVALYNARAGIHVAMRNWEQALADYERGEPEGEDKLRMGQVVSILKQPDRAEAIFSEVIEDDPTSNYAKVALMQLGKMKFRGKDYDASIGTFNQLVELDPESGEAYFFLGLSHKEMERYPEAVEALRRASEIEPEKADRHFWLGILYAQIDSTAEARRAFEVTVSIDSLGSNKNTGIALRQLGFYDLLESKYVSAIKLLDRAAVINEKDIQAWVWLAQAWQNSGNKAKACEAYKRALQLDPKQPDAVSGSQSLGC